MLAGGIWVAVPALVIAPPTGLGEPRTGDGCSRRAWDVGEHDERLIGQAVARILMVGYACDYEVILAVSEVSIRGHCMCTLRRTVHKRPNRADRGAGPFGGTLCREFCPLGECRGLGS